MKVSELIEICGNMLSLNTADMSGTDSRALKNAFEFVFDEVYRNYALSIRKTVVEAAGGFVDTTAYKPCKVLSLTDEEGAEVPFRYSEGSLYTARSGKFNMCYARVPDVPGLEDEIVLPANISERTLAYGIAREYCTMLGDWDSASQWDTRYTQSLRAAACKTSELRMPARRWLP